MALQLKPDQNITLGIISSTVFNVKITITSTLILVLITIMHDQLKSQSITLNILVTKGRNNQQLI